jgi:hypothetical protein
VSVRKDFVEFRDDVVVAGGFIEEVWFAGCIEGGFIEVTVHYPDAFKVGFFPVWEDVKEFL